MDCTNTKGKFSVPTRNNREINCAQVERSLKAKGWCDEPAVLENCPSHCNSECIGTCDDVLGGTFLSVNGKTKYCSSVRDYPDRCDKSPYQTNCPRSCGLCPEGTFRFDQCPEDGACCNGLSTNCELGVNEIMFATVHNAQHHMPPIPNNKAPLEEALEAGYRGLMLDFCKCDGVLRFCHGVCNVVSPSNVFNEIQV